MSEPRLIPLPDYREYSPREMRARARRFLSDLMRRRSVRQISDHPVPLEIVQDCVKAAASAPSGANRQPWHFVVVQDPKIKHSIRIAAEKEERDFYEGRAPDDWLEALKPFSTDQFKPFLESAPYLIAVFAERYGFDERGRRRKNYYVSESVGIAVGLLIVALHRAGLVCLTHTPAPMAFLSEILGRPANERPYLLLPVGYPAPDARVPDIRRKSLDEVATFL